MVLRVPLTMDLLGQEMPVGEISFQRDGSIGGQILPHVAQVLEKLDTHCDFTLVANIGFEFIDEEVTRMETPNG